jgi:glycosyltransferase involved in cell wall biosynthesis
MYYQLISYNFLNPEVVDEEIQDLLDDLYSQIYNGFDEELRDEYEYIPKEKRNKDFVMVFISQLLAVGHGPTTTMLDRCYVLEKYMNKRVFIVNTAEFRSTYQPINWFRLMIGTYIDDYNDKSLFPYLDREFMFYQCPNAMPQTSVIREILNVVKSEKPYCIVNIGGNSITNDICSHIVPTVTLATVFSDRTQTRGQFQVIGRALNDSDCKWLEKHNYTNDYIIQSPFTFSFKEQKHQYTREELQLPQDQFVVAMVGGRLDQEIDDVCIDLLYRLTEENIYIVFIGIFEKYYECITERDDFKKNSLYMGMQGDVLAIDECCDAYLNPKRVGGGTSAAEAMSKGLPVVTFDFGDVGVVAGDEFHVESYEDMYRQILRYAQDREYYNTMSEKAKQRADFLTDSKSQFIKVMNTIEYNARF